MAEDLDRFRTLVLDWLSGVVHVLGQQFGVPTPPTAPRTGRSSCTRTAGPTATWTPRAS